MKFRRRRRSGKAVAEVRHRVHAEPPKDVIPSPRPTLDAPLIIQTRNPIARGARYPIGATRDLDMPRPPEWTLDALACIALPSNADTNHVLQPAGRAYTQHTHIQRLPNRG